MPNNYVLTSVVLTRKIVFLSLFVLLPGITHGGTDCADKFSRLETTYQKILDSYLTQGSKNSLEANMVNYSKLRSDEDFEDLVVLVELFPKDCLQTREQEIAFYLNAYNILAMNKVVENWPIEKLRSLGNFMRPVWTHPAGLVCNEKVTLRHLEHEVLRKLDEPRIHVAINCASMSCPDLRAEPYKAEILDAQLTDQTNQFLRQDGKGVSHLGNNEIEVSSIFEWFEDDFGPEGGAEKFINDHLPEYGGRLKIVSYLDYDWDVNCKLNALQRKRSRKAERPQTWFN